LFRGLGPLSLVLFPPLEISLDGMKTPLAAVFAYLGISANSDVVEWMLYYQKLWKSGCSRARQQLLPDSLSPFRPLLSAKIITKNRH